MEPEFMTFIYKTKRCSENFTLLTRNLALVIVSLASAPVLHAAPIVIGFEGSVRELICGFCGPFNIGDSVLGKLTYETDAIDLAPNDADFGRYQLSGPGYGISLLVDNNYYYELAGLEISVRNNSFAPNLSNPCGMSYESGLTAYDEIAFRSTQNGTGLFFYNCSANALVSDALVPLSQIGTGPTDFLLGGYNPDRSFQIIDDPYNGNSHIFSVNIGHLFVVPEPATLALLALGLAGLGFSRRKHP
jgi:hypothetical protein